MSDLHFHPLRVAAVEADGDDALVVRFDTAAEPEGRWHFEPGQWLTLRAVIDGAEQRRSYSICSGPGEPLRVGVRQVPGGRFSGWLHGHLRPGDRIDVMPPQGRFGAALAARPRHVLAVAGGSGITPVLSILKAHLGRDDEPRATLVYANRSMASTMFREELEDLKNRHLASFALFTLFSREQLDAPLAQGRPDPARLAAILRLVGGAAAVDHAFVCGPHAMNDEVEAALVAAGVPAAQVHVERFGAPPEAGDARPHEARPGDAARARISVVRDGVTRELAFADGDESLLAAAVRAGLDLPYSCQSGVCATCRCKLLEGQVRMDRNFALPPDELAAGFVLACQAHPLTERVAVSFDER